VSVRLKPLEEQVILITGASSGIGLITARRAARRGAKVMLVSRNAAALNDIVDGIAQGGGEADFAVADVGDRQALAAAAAKTVERFGRIDSWVNNAGVAIYAKLTETPDGEHERLFRTNYFGVVNGSTIAVEHLKARGGALITVASIAADMPSPILGAYTASKYAVKAFLESLRIELQADGAPISLTLIKPAGMATPIATHAANHLDGEARVPPPPYDPRLVAKAILDASEHPRREITVGGIGRAQVLFAEHFPALFERIAPVVIPFLSSRQSPSTSPDSLWSPGKDGMEYSPHGRGIRHSAYTWSKRHPGAALALGAVGIGAALMIPLLYLARRRVRSTR
jgi:short-subunit dehydrogenase